MTFLCKCIRCGSTYAGEGLCCSCLMDLHDKEMSEMLANETMRLDAIVPDTRRIEHIAEAITGRLKDSAKTSYEIARLIKVPIKAVWEWLNKHRDNEVELNKGKWRIK